MINLFTFGQKVVCIDPDYDGGLDVFGNTLPRVGCVYTIRGFVEEPTDYKILGLLLEEIINKPLPCEPDGRLGERAWDTLDFRPVKETDIWAAKKVSEPV